MLARCSSRLASRHVRDDLAVLTSAPPDWESATARIATLYAAQFPALGDARLRRDRTGKLVRTRGWPPGTEFRPARRRHRNRGRRIGTAPRPCGICSRRPPRCRCWCCAANVPTCCHGTHLPRCSGGAGTSPQSRFPARATCRCWIMLQCCRTSLPSSNAAIPHRPAEARPRTPPSAPELPGRSASLRIGPTKSSPPPRKGLVQSNAGRSQLHKKKPRQLPAGVPFKPSEVRSEVPAARGACQTKRRCWTWHSQRWWRHQPHSSWTDRC